jgi:hypothetical protein
MTVSHTTFVVDVDCTRSCHIIHRLTNAVPYLCRSHLRWFSVTTTTNMRIREQIPFNIVSVRYNVILSNKFGHILVKYLRYFNIYFLLPDLNRRLHVQYCFNKQVKLILFWHYYRSTICRINCRGYMTSAEAWEVDTDMSLLFSSVII